MSLCATPACWPCVPTARLHVVEGGGHLFLLDESGSVAGTIRGFLDADR